MRFLRYVGRRGASLLFVALTFLSNGYRMISQGPSSPENYSILFKIMGADLWGILLISVAILMIVGALWKRLEAIGFALSSALVFTWSLAFAGALIIGEYSTFAAALLASVIYFTFGGFLLMIGGWPEAPPPEDHHKRDVNDYVRWR